MLAKVLSGTNVGLAGIMVTVEVDVAERGFPTFTIVGLPNKSVDEAKDRVRTAIVNAGYMMPDSRITVNLAPADIPKTGSGFDLAIALGILSASRVFEGDFLRDKMFVGELSLEGGVRRVNGIIPLILLAQEMGINEIFIPKENIDEASLFEGINIYPVESLQSVLNHLGKMKLIETYEFEQLDDRRKKVTFPLDMSEIKGQEQAKRALEIAASGFHNLHFKGPPGAGKTLLSRTLPSILPLLERKEMLEVAKIYSVIGDLKKSIFTGVRPFRSPHHTTSRVGLIGGGAHPMPGEISLAHRGVLFLDEFPEFPRSVLEAMRQPLEDGVVTVSRASGSLTFPARFLLLAASNPCPCGFLGHPTKQCNCFPGHIMKYKKRLSGPLLDRIDLHIDVPPVEVDKLSTDFESESSFDVSIRVAGARERQRKRFKNTKINFNSEMSSADIKRLVSMTSDAENILKKAIGALSLSARSYFKTIKVAQTIADLHGEDEISGSHISEALQYRKN